MSEKYQSFFYELKLLLDGAKSLAENLDRELAHRFNVLQYLRTDEHGLSHIIADLLDPKGNHGQGSFFLRMLLENIGIESDTFNLQNLELTAVTVEREFRIEGERRIDIYIKIPGRNDNEMFRLAIENKPYSGDQENQVIDYLKHLEKMSGESELNDNFLLIYLSGSGEGPSEWSLPKSEREKWTDHLKVMPYHNQFRLNDNDEINEFLDTSLTDWLARCREKSQVDRLRWFLKDVEIFCKQNFGDSAMTNDVGTKVIKEYLSDNDIYLEVAHLVHTTWPEVRNEICEKFWNQMCRKIKEELENGELSKYGNICVYHEGKSQIERSKPFGRLWLYCNGNNTIKSTDSSVSLHLTNDFGVPIRWWIGVQLPKENPHTDKLCERISKSFDDLKQGINVSWFKYLREYTNWDEIVPKLHQENEDKGGDVTEYYMKEFCNLAKKIIPVVDEIHNGGN